MKLLVAYIIFAVASIGFLSFANADVKEFVVPVPFDYQNSGCTLVINSTDYKKYDCTATWKSSDFKYEDELTTPAEDGCTSGFDRDPRIDECRPYDILQEEAKQVCFDDPECPLGIYEPKPDPDPRIDEDSDKISDQELIKKINAIIPDVNCYQGRGTTDGIQNIRDFPIPVQEVQKFVDGKKITTHELDLSTPSSPIEIRGYYATIVMAAFECHAQNTLLNDQGGILSSQDRTVGYCDRFAETLTTEESIQAGCGVTSGSYYASLHRDVPIMTQEMANQKANFGIEKSTTRDKSDPVCSHNYGESLRKAYRCPELEKPESGNGKIPEMLDYHNNVAGERYMNYLNDDGELQSKLLAREAIEAKIAKLMEALKQFK